MLRDTLLYLSNQPRVFNYVRNSRLAKHFAKRFVPGETLDEALEVVRALNARGISASLDLLGESVHERARGPGGARRVPPDPRSDSRDAPGRERLGQAHRHGARHRPRALRRHRCRTSSTRAQQYGSFVRIDMEASAYTDVTLKMFEERFYPTYKANVGVVLQSYLYRTFADVEHMNALRARVRICKGAYKEPPSVAYPEKKDVDANYVKCMRELMLRGNYPGIATHDPAMINEAKRWAKEQGIEKDRFEFQMLYGVRRDLQQSLVREGYRMRVYVPFGTQWYPYLMRRLAERPANVAFITGNVIREALHLRR